MALKGTLKDFGIADILQLISHQSKTGVLRLQSKDREVRVFFITGNVIKAESSTRKKKDLLGAMLVRAEILSEAQLDQALEIQKRTLKRLGDILVENGLLKRDELNQISMLQTTETLYRLFSWETGTYQFEPEEVPAPDPGILPIRSENVLMEGFRQVDEWPMVRKKITSYELTFKKTKELPADVTEPEPESDSLDDDIDSAFSFEAPKKKKSSDVSKNEVRVFGLISDERNVQKLIDLSRLGEFETCKALLGLINQGFIKAIPRKDVKPSVDKPGLQLKQLHLGRFFIQVGVYVLIAAVLLLLYHGVNWEFLSLGQQSGPKTFREPTIQSMIDLSQDKRLRAMLEIFRLEFGEYPQSLQALVDAGLVAKNELRYPWRNDRVYLREQNGFELLRPFE